MWVIQRSGRVTSTIESVSVLLVDFAAKVGGTHGLREMEKGGVSEKGGIQMCDDFIK